MFEIINQTSADPEDRKMLYYKIGMFLVALAAAGGVVVFFVHALS